MLSFNNDQHMRVCFSVLSERQGAIPEENFLKILAAFKDETLADSVKSGELLNTSIWSFVIILVSFCLRDCN